MRAPETDYDADDDAHSSARATEAAAWQHPCAAFFGCLRNRRCLLSRRFIIANDSITQSPNYKARNLVTGELVFTQMWSSIATSLRAAKWPNQLAYQAVGYTAFRLLPTALGTWRCG